MTLLLQLVVVVTSSWDAPTGELTRWERSGAGWHQVGPSLPVSLGAKGLAWGRGLHSAKATKREGDLRSPAGIFALGPEYDAAELVCVDDPGSPDYNRVVEKGRGEDMRRYRKAIFVGHNPAHSRGAGSCIFLHDGASPTVGCTAMAPQALDELTAWLKQAWLVQFPEPARLEICRDLQKRVGDFPACQGRK